MKVEFVNIILKEGVWRVRAMGRKKFLTEKVFLHPFHAEFWVRKSYPGSWVSYEINKDSGDLLTLEQWLESVRCGGFIGDDGWGDLLDKDFNVVKRGFSPEDVGREEIDENVVEWVLWYNR